MVMLAGRAIQLRDVLEMYLGLGGRSLVGNKYLLVLVVDKASKFPFAFPLRSKQADGVARHILRLRLTFGVPRAIGANGGLKFTADVIQSLCRGLRTDI